VYLKEGDHFVVFALFSSATWRRPTAMLQIPLYWASKLAIFNNALVFHISHPFEWLKWSMARN